MNKFEKYLIDKGYVKHIKKGDKLIKTDKHVLSSLVNLVHFYIKGDREIIFGLNEYLKPPTLLYPRPSIKQIEDGKVYNNKGDSIMHRVLDAVDYDTIYELMFDDTRLIQFKDGDITIENKKPFDSIVTTIYR